VSYPWSTGVFSCALDSTTVERNRWGCLSNAHRGWFVEASGSSSKSIRTGARPINGEIELTSSLLVTGIPKLHKISAVFTLVFDCSNP